MPHPVDVAPARGLTRLVRAAALGGLSLLLATSAHLLGGGALPPVEVLVVAGVLLGLGAAVLTRWRGRFVWLAPLLTVQQVLLHELFDVASAAGRCSSPAPPMAHHIVTAHPLALCAGAGDLGMAMHGPAWHMWAAHLLATAATAWLLARGEAWLWRTVDRVGAAAALGRASTCVTSRRQRVTTPFGFVLAGAARWSPAGPRGPPEAVVG